MKKVILKTAIIAGMTTAQALGDIALAISPEIKGTNTARIVNVGVRRIVGQMELSETLDVYDGITMKKIVSIQIPSDPKFKGRSGAKRQHASKKLKRLENWLRFGGKKVEKRTFRLNIPTIYEHVAAYSSLRKNGGKLVLVGSMIYHDPLNPVYSFCLFKGKKHDIYPSDSMIEGRDNRSRFKVSDQPERLKNVTVHWNELGLDQKSHDYRRSVQRWWSIWSSAQSAELMQIQSDTRDFFKGIFADHKTPFQNAKADLSVAPMMIRLNGRRIDQASPVESIPPIAVPERVEPSSAPSVAKKLAPVVTTSEAINEALDAKALKIIYVIDGSGSIEKHRPHIRRVIEGSKITGHQQLAVVTYTSAKVSSASEPAARLCVVGASPLKVAETYMKIPYKACSTEMHAGLALALETVRDHSATEKYQVMLMTDEVPRDASKCATLIGKIMKAGCQVSIYPYGGCKTFWLPKGVQVAEIN